MSRVHNIAEKVSFYTHALLQYLVLRNGLNVCPTMLRKEKINLETGGKSYSSTLLKNRGAGFSLISDFSGKIEGDYACKVVMAFTPSQPLKNFGAISRQ